jgi:hypothetical protein
VLEREEQMGKSSKQKSESAKKKSKKNGAESKADGEGSALSKAKVPAAATGAVLIGAAGAATIKKSRDGKGKGRLLGKAAKTSSPVLSAAGSQARRLKKLVPGS